MTVIETEQYNSFTQLDAECVAQQQVSANCNLCPGTLLSYLLKNRYPYPIYGRWGVQLRFPSNEVEDGNIVIAQIGFNEVGNKIIITNSPQGVNRVSLGDFGEDTQKAVWQKLRTGGFREELLREVISIASRLKGLGISHIFGTSAYNHPKVEENGGALPFKTAIKSMDDLYQKNGFATVSGGDYSLPI